MAFICPNCGYVTDALIKPAKCFICDSSMLDAQEYLQQTPAEHIVCYGGGGGSLCTPGTGGNGGALPTVKPIGDNQWLDGVSETAATYMDYEDALVDRESFVHNLGVLLTQTREGVGKCELIDNGDTVLITFKGDVKRSVNVRLNSYAAIIRDVMRNV